MASGVIVSFNAAVYTQVRLIALAHLERARASDGLGAGA